VHARLADLYQQLFRWSEAEAEYKRALELKPNDAATHLSFAFWLVCQGRMERQLPVPAGPGVGSACDQRLSARCASLLRSSLR